MLLAKPLMLLGNRAVGVDMPLCAAEIRLNSMLRAFVPVKQVSYAASQTSMLLGNRAVGRHAAVLQRFRQGGAGQVQMRHR